MIVVFRIYVNLLFFFFFFFQAEDGIRDLYVTGVQTCALPIFADSLTDSAAKSLSSITISGELGIGYDLNEGVVIGGGLTFDWGLAPSAKIGDVSNDIDTANLTLVMAFVDYYLAPREHGWHLLGGLGYGG